ncbi:hypothetical protein IFR05_014512 [Cadophora sp. M221]|nr:hypothetical protein IFR05_014512 [Cadophora sp. M221]
MPTYGPLGTTVSLYTWDPNTSPAISAQGDTVDCEVERIREDKFDNQGLDFLGPSSVPFFLVNAGQDLFSPAAPDDDDDTAAPVAKVICINSTPALVKSTSPAAKTPIATASPTNDLTDSDHDTTISTLNSSLFEMSPGGDMDGPSNNAAENIGARNTSSRPKRNVKETPRPFQPPVIAKKPMSKPITSPKPIKLQVDLSNKSFMHSLITNIPEDVSISVFYNGEFVSSRVFRWNTFNSGQKSEGGHPTVSGRRIGTNLEVPWIIKSMSQEAPTSFISPTMSTTEATWGKINQNLLVEADEWGRDGKFDMFRNPVGEYLEYLSKMSIPKKAWPLGGSDLNIGVIDVIIGLGRSINHPYKCLVAPQRKLAQGLCGIENKLYVVPKELSSINLNQMIASFQNEEDQKANRAPKNARKTGNRTKATISRTTTGGQSNASQNSATITRHGSRATSVSNSVTGNAIGSVPTGGHDGLVERDQQPTLSMAFNIPLPVSPLKKSVFVESPGALNASNLPSNPTDKPPAPKSKLPKSIPQKRYRGATPPPAEVNAVTPGCIEPPSHSTRSRTSLGSAGSPDDVSPAASKLQSSQKPAGRIRKSPTHRQRAKSQSSTSSATPLPKSNSFGLDGVDDDYYEIWIESINFSRSLCSPLRQLASTKTNQLHREHLDFGFDGTGDDPKSIKRKRASLEPPLSAAAPKSKVSRTKAKGRNVSGSSAQSQSSPTNKITASGDIQTVPQVEIDSFSLSNELKNSTPITDIAVRKPRPRNPLSARELDNLLEPHKPSVNADTSFGHSFTENSNPSRSTRNSSSRQKLVPQPASSTPPRISATVEDGRILVIKGLRPGEMPQDTEKVWSLEATAPDSPTIAGNERAVPVEKIIAAIATEGSSTSILASRVLRSAKPTDIGVPNIKFDTMVKNDDLKVHKSAQILPAKSKSEVEETLSKNIFPVSLKTKYVNTVPARHFVIDGTTKPGLSSSKQIVRSMTGINSAAENKKENVRPSFTTSARPGSGRQVLEVATRSIGIARASSTALPAKPLNGQGAEPDRAVNSDKMEITSALKHDQQPLSGKAAGQSGNSKPKRKEILAAPEASIPVESHPTPNIQKPSAKKPPLMKFKLPTSTTTPIEPQTPSNRQSKAKPGLTIQPGLANAYRSYSETSTGLKTPTPRSGTFPKAQAPEPPRTRASTRAMQDSPNVSAIAMPSMINFTPQKSRTPSNRLRAEMSSSPAVPSPAPGTRETRILPPRRSLYDSPSSSRVLRSIKQTSTPISMDLTKTPENLTTPDVFTTKSAAQQPRRLPSITGASPGENVVDGYKTPQRRQAKGDANQPWKPTNICHDSVLSYVDENNSVGLPGLKYAETINSMCGSTRAEREGVFRTTGILMGVRYVLGLGSETTKKN